MHGTGIEVYLFVKFILKSQIYVYTFSIYNFHWHVYTYMYMYVYMLYSLEYHVLNQS